MRNSTFIFAAEPPLALFVARLQAGLEGTGWRAVITSTHREDHTAHAEGRAVDLTLPDAIAGVQLPLSFLDAIADNARFAYTQLLEDISKLGPDTEPPSITILWETDHVHVEIDRMNAPPGLSFGLFPHPQGGPDLVLYDKETQS